MTALVSLRILMRQLTAHRAFVARRAAGEFAALLLARPSRRLQLVARLAVWLHPASADAHFALAACATRAGDDAAARRHELRAREFQRNTLEISVMATLGRALAPWRRSLAAASSASQMPGEFTGSASGANASVARRVARLLETARSELAESHLEAAQTALWSACDLDPGHHDVRAELGRCLLQSSDLEEARAQLEHAVKLDPTRAEYQALLGDCWLPDDSERARLHWSRALEHRPMDTSNATRIEDSHEADRARATDLSLQCSTRALTLRVGERAEAVVEVRAGGGTASLYVVEPTAAGVTCEPHGRTPLSEGQSRVSIRLHAHRPDRINAGRPWTVALHLLGAPDVAPVSLQVEVAVPDSAPGRVFYLITEDHELYDERESTTAEAAQTTLVEKSALAEQIANEAGARWTHMVDVGSQALIEWAASRSRRSAWADTAAACREHLLRSVETGNDLGLHVHAFHDPAYASFCHDFDEDGDRVTTRPEFLETPLPRRGFWSRCFEPLGTVDLEGSRAWATWRGIGWLESIGRLADPRFRVTIFRAGSFDFGETACDRANSLALLRRLDILADSDVPKPRLYHRAPGNTRYPVSDDPRTPEPDGARMRVLEIRAEFNIEADFLSTTEVLDQYVDRRVRGLRSGRGTLESGVHVICAMTHDKFINWRMGRRWDSLDPGYGDWKTIASHLKHVRTRHPEVEFATAREAILAWYDDATPELRAWRDEEIVELSGEDASEEIFRYRIRLLGNGIAVSGERTHDVAVALPAWLAGRILDARIERDGLAWPSAPFETGHPRLEFELDSRDARWELVIRAPAGDGISARPSSNGALQLSSRHPYRRATVLVPERWTPTGRASLLRDIALEPGESGYRATIRTDELRQGETDSG